MAASMEKLVTKAIDQYLKLYQNPEDFFSINKKLVTNLKSTTKSIYEITRHQISIQNAGLPELIIKDFDDEQIWQQLELRNDSSVQNLLSDVARLVASKDSLAFQPRGPDRHDKTTKTSGASDDAESSADAPSSEENDSDSDTDTELSRIKARLSAIENNPALATGSDSDLDFDFDVGNDDDADDDVEGDKMDDGEGLGGGESDSEEQNSRRKKPSYKSEVDDRFFKMADLEEFLSVEDAKEERRRRREMQGTKPDDENDDDSEEDDDVDMFQNISSSDEDEEARNLKYTDFFEPPDEETENTRELKEKTSGKEAGRLSKKKVSFSEEKKSGVKRKKDGSLLPDSDSEGEEIVDVIGGKTEENLSTYEKRQKKLKTKIAEMEDASLVEKPWQLSGEITAQARPENSLLEEYVQFEHTTRQAPVITEETTKTLEDIIRQRIKDQSWDDVERKEKRKEEPFEYKKRIALDMEQSKLSLGEVYEQEFLKQQQKEEEEKEDPQHEDIRKMMTSLFLKLDALCNFHYTPKQILPEVKIVSNVPSIVMEEVAPVSVSDAKLLAPHEIQEKEKGELKGKQEKSVADRKRERRNKKAMKRQRRLDKEKREKVVSRMNPGLGNKYSKEKAMKDLEKQSKLAKNVTVIKDSASRKAVGSSTAFFTQLQEEVTSHIQKSKEKKVAKKTDRSSALKLKL
ncbi:U3 small nucleolar ribonucleoprotein protein MPP10-like [Gigantopelta aegis]|uniref:U3 small nucleolar ribonucleoprotein protein MPP10-like n=1 Tax=Gigantopelta aegis TaxID=1735272 RepID=UPI001B8891F0|nr:U3 small nucleolar ribonucleoprotein protein MPP10-like [Gigantopelta aegis]